jgi:hypothetical protein
MSCKEEHFSTLFETDFVAQTGAAGGQRYAFSTAKFTACMEDMARDESRCSTTQWRAGPADDEPAAEKRNQGLAKPRRPDRLAAMLPPDRASWSTPPLPPSTGIPTTPRAAVSSMAVMHVEATAVFPAAARRRRRAVA